MSTRPIVVLGDPVLRLKGERVVRFDRALGQLLDDMLETMRAAPGVGLAAQQVGLAMQLCVIEVEEQVHELINPRIVRLSGEQTDIEGCLSLPGYWAERRRAMTAVVEAQNRHGRKIRLTGSGLLARAIQHEFDHLQGELYIDQLGPDAHLITSEELQAMHDEEVGMKAAEATAEAGAEGVGSSADGEVDSLGSPDEGSPLAESVSSAP
jgi:peptide deformylase